MSNCSHRTKPVVDAGVDCWPLLLRRGSALAVWLGLMLICVGIVSLPNSAFSQGSDPDGHVESMLEKATKAYDTLKMKEAQSILSDAIDYATQNQVSPSVHARAHILMGVVQFAQTRDNQTARNQFIKALEIHRDAKVPDVYKTPTLTKLMKQAHERADLASETKTSDSSGDKAEPDPAPDPTKEAPETFQHTPVTTANAGEDLKLVAKMPAELNPKAVYVYARRYDQQEYWRTQMSAVSEERIRWSVTLPGKKVYTSQFDYYIEVVDTEDSVVASSGSPANPHSVTVLGSASYTPPQASAGDSGGSGGAGPTGPSGPPSGEETDRGRDYVYLQATGGTAAGLIFSGDPTANPGRDVKPGLAPAFGHARLDIGGMLTQRTHLGMFFRWQFSPAQQFQGLDHIEDSGFPTTEAQCLGIGIIGDCQLGLMVRHFFSSSPDLRVFASGGLGVGRVREWLRLKEPASDDFCDERRTYNSGGNSFCYRRDTIRPGWFHFGGGGGLQWPLTNSFSLIAEGYLQVLVPTAAVHLDINVGPRFEF